MSINITDVKFEWPTESELNEWRDSPEYEAEMEAAAQPYDDTRVPEDYYEEFYETHIDLLIDNYPWY
jgi:hypothetical protein